MCPTNPVYSIGHFHWKRNNTSEECEEEVEYFHCVTDRYIVGSTKLHIHSARTAIIMHSLLNVKRAGYKTLNDRRNINIPL